MAADCICYRYGKAVWRQSAARQYVLEALADEKEIELDSLELMSGTEADMRLSPAFKYKGDYTVNLKQRFEVIW